ncbi:MAG: hypothetical protein ACI4R8_03460 [Candidatus Caccovivens sp.]
MTKKKSLLTFVLAVCLIVPALFMLTACGHTHSVVEDWSSDETYHWHACAGCEEQLDKAEHTWGEWTITAESTCTEERTCTVCGKKESRENHEFTYEYNAATCTLVAPTKETEGKLLLKCNNCDHKEEILVYPVISDKDYSESCVYNSGWKYFYQLKNDFYTENSISDEIKTIAKNSAMRIYMNIEVCEEASGCKLVELIESETSDELYFNYEFTEAGRYYIALRDSSTTKAFKSITFNPAADEKAVVSLFVYNESGAKPTDDSTASNIFTFTSTYFSNSVKSSGDYLIVVDVQTAGAGTFTMEIAE